MKAAIAVLALATATSAASAATITGLYNTGVDAQGNTLPYQGRLSIGPPESHFTVTTPTGPSTAVTFSYPTYFANTATADWISVFSPGTSTLDFGVGAYTYQEQITSSVAATYSFTGDWGADNCGSISVNGASVSGTGTLIGSVSPSCSRADWGHFERPTTFSFDATLNAGLNTLDFNVWNTNLWTSLFVDNLAATCDSGCSDPTAVPEPGTLALVALAMAGVGIGRRVRRN
jgi:PEP-CTERM motif-containing protein